MPYIQGNFQHLVCTPVGFVLSNIVILNRHCGTVQEKTNID